ncbi:Tn3 family transposase [Nonomuraea sp. H19]|uniref:Tn3 family transposase n=1 Tax=Nonomuraea sp. H19 TaxID=3452206 RepID=UPI003F8C4D28
MAGTGQGKALERVEAVWALGGGAVDTLGVAPVKLAELAAYGMSAKAPKIKQLEAMRRSATLLATVWHLEGASVDDALLLFDVLMATRLLSRAARAGREQKLQSLPRLRKAAADLAAAVAVVYATPLEAEKGPTRAADLVGRIEQVISKERLTAALDLIAELVPGEEDDNDLEWRAELIARFKTVRPFIDSLAQAIPWSCTPAGTPIVKAVKDLPTLLARGKYAGVEHMREHDGLVSGSWRRLVYHNPNLPDGSLDRAAYTFCLLEALHAALRRRDVYAVGADRWGDPRGKLIPQPVWQVHRDSVLTALGLETDPTRHLKDLAEDLDAAYKQVAANPAVTVKGGRLNLEKLEALPLPDGYQAVHDAVQAMLPRIDYPELLLEVNGHTGFLEVMPHLSGSEARRPDLDISQAGVLVARSCNVGFVPVLKAGQPALTLSRLRGVEKGYFHHEGLAAASATLVTAQSDISIAVQDWGGGLVASADGLRFVVPVKSLHARPNPVYFGRGKRSRGSTWLAVVNDRVMGLGGLVVPGTMRDSLFILDALHRLDAIEQPDIVTTDTASYSDIVFGLFAICGYQFAPRIADIGDAQMWRLDLVDAGLADQAVAKADNGYRHLNDLGLRKINIRIIRHHWAHMLHVAGSLVTNQVRAYDLLRMLSADGRLTGLGAAFAHYGRIFKSMHLLHVAHLEDYRRMMGAQLNIGEGRNGLARRVFFGNLGQLRQGYAKGMEDQLGALGLGLNAIIYWNSLYIDAAVKALQADGQLVIGPEIRARLTPLIWEHINFHGTYPFTRPETPGNLRPLRDARAEDDEQDY